METLMIVLTLLMGACNSKVVSNDANMQPKTSIYDLKFTAIDGQVIDFKQYKGKKLLIVNTASECGYTPQYSDLEKLNEEYGNKIVVLGFPANNFGGQEPGSNTEIKGFCQKNYGVTFQLFEKSSVKGDDKNVIYQWLTDKNKNGWNDQEPTWNFCKYLINEKGELVKFFPSKVKPTDSEIISML
ncbi:glutathione peroxidase [Solitalea sp. MAHUQ-68]|uniref:Glutathione peroxidase n=1 Tax=Solitalea agri TaxID=2953739 RepID=A0A9X2JEE9_9SPHI|nr:glutathione peroxidase [Solitalea agri]MCO4292316.1 glutathione peroxidase [Solitalea agri]